MCSISLLAGVVLGQSADWSVHDDKIAALCTTATGTPPSGPKLQQVSRTTFTVYAMGSPDQVFIKDQYGTTLSYLEKIGNNAIDLGSVDIGEINTPDEVVAYAHYDSNCNLVRSNNTQTWKSMVSEYVSSDTSSFSSALETLTEDDVESAKPQLTNVNYATRSATVTFTRLKDLPMPYLYVKDQEGALVYVHTFDSTPSTSTSFTDSLVIPDLTTSLSACTFSCNDYSPNPPAKTLPDQIADDIEGKSTDGGALGVTPVLTDEILTVPADCATSDYVLYAKADGKVVALAEAQELSIRTGVSISTVVVTQLCSGVRKTQSVGLGPLRLAYQSAMDSRPIASQDSQVVPLSCTENGVTHSYDAIWRDSTGATCACRQGNVECGSVLRHKTYFSGWEVAGISISSMVLFLVVAAIAYVQYMKQNARRVVEGRRKLSAGQVYRTSGTAGGAPGQHEIELPTPAGSITPG